MDEDETDKFRRKLFERKSKVDKLTKHMQKHEREHEESLKSHKDFLDAKNTKTTSSITDLLPSPTTSRSSRVGPGPSTKPTQSTIPSTIISKTVTETTEYSSSYTSTRLDPSSMTVPATSTDTLSVAPSQTTTNRSDLSLPELESQPSQSLGAMDSSRKSILRSMKMSRAFSAVGINEPKPTLRAWTPKNRRSEQKPPKTKSDPDKVKAEASKEDKGSEDSTSSSEILAHVVDVLECLTDLQYVFMQRIFEVKELENSGVLFQNQNDNVDLTYQIFTLDGDLLFLMEQKTIKCTSFILFARRSYENTLYDTEGNKILKFIGPTMAMSRMISSSKVTDPHGNMLGYVKTFGSKCNYSVYNAKGQRLFLLLSNTLLPSPLTVFVILCKGKQIGSIKYAWKRTFHDAPFINYETTGVEFPEEMDEREKALLIGAMILLEFTWFSPITKLKISTILALLILVALGLVIFSLPFIMDRQHADYKTKAFFSAQERKNMSSLWNPSNYSSGA